MNLFQNKKIPPPPPLQKGGNTIGLLSGLGVYPSLAKRGKGRFCQYIKPASKHCNYVILSDAKNLAFSSSYEILHSVQDDNYNCRVNNCTPPGFTLIEILIAVAILSIVLGAIYSTFFLSQRAIEGMDESMVRIQESRNALDIIKRELESAFFAGNDSATFLRMQDRDVFGKQASQIAFTAFSLLRPGLSRIAYYIEDTDGKLDLYKKVESPYSGEETEGVDIIEDLQDFTVEAKYNDRWVKTWDTDINKNIPDEIRISLTMMIKGRKVTISDISKPRIGRSV